MISTREGRELNLFVNEKEKEEYEVLSVSPTTLEVELGLVVLNFWIYHVWLWGKIRTLLPMTCLISSTNESLLIMTTNLLTKNILDGTYRMHY